MADSIERAVKQLAVALQPFAAALGRDDDEVIAFVESLGWTLPSVPPAIKALAATARTMAELSTTLELGESVQASGGALGVDATKYVKLAEAVIDLITQIGHLPTALSGQLPAAFLGASDFAAQFGRHLLDRAVVLLLTTRTKRIEPILRVAGIIEVVYEPEVPASFQPAYTRHTVHWDRIGDLLSNPPKLLRDAYGWGTPAFDARLLFDSIMHLSFALGGPAELDWPTPARIQALTGTLPAFDGVGAPNIIVPFVDHDMLQAGASVLPLPAAGGQLPGVALGVFVDATLPPQLQLSDLIALRIDAPNELGAGISVALRPGAAPRVRLGLEGPGGAAPVAPRVGLAIVIGRTVPMEVFELPGGTKLEVGSVSVGGGVGSLPSGVQPYVDIAIDKGKLTLALGGGDGFLNKIMPSGPMELTFDLGMTWTPAGVQLRGSGALTLSVPLHLDLGPFHLDTLFLVATLDGAALQLETSISGGASLGPLKAIVERVGVVTTLAMKPGNLGPVDLGVSFKPPNGVGLSVDAGVVSGGGYLFIDSARGEYAGALELDLFGIVTIKAIGLITTKTPDGKPGFSLLIIMSVEFGSGFQLSFGFTLVAVGGLLGLNRTMNLDALAEGVRNGSLDSIMFPKDIIANAPKIISDLRAFFPPKEGVFLIGPMVKIGWGTPTLASISLGIIVEIPGNIAIVGIIKVAIPTEEAALILLQVNFLGAIELDKQRVWFFASLFGSRIVFLTIEGEMGLLMAYGNEPNFVLTVGGFHPRFAPPPLPFPSPKRIAVNLLSTPVSRMRIEGYFAVTTNTVQFGARVDVMFGLDEINVKGNLAFDALFQFSPFHFEIEISASLSVNVFGAGLFSVSINGILDGPSPWHVKGHGSISLLFWDIDVDFETTWGESQNTELPPIPVLPILQGELAKDANWRAILPPGNNLLVTLRPMDAIEKALVLHPVGVLRVSQRSLPLDLQLDKIGGQKPNDVKRLSIAVSSAGLRKTADAFEQFAPAQFQNFSDADKLSKPAFAPEHSGVDITADGADVRTSSMVRRVVRYEEIIIDSNYKRFARRFRAYLGALFDLHLLGAAVAKNVNSKAFKTRLQPFEDKIAVSPTGYVVAFQADNKAMSPAAVGFVSAVSAHQFLADAVGANASLADTIHVIPQFEMAS